MGQSRRSTDREVSDAAAKVPAKLRAFLADLSQVTDPEMRAELLIEYGARFREVPPEIAARPFAEQSKVPACESEAYVFYRPLPGEGTAPAPLKFYFAVENPQGISAMALAAIIDETLSGSPLEEVAEVSEELVYDIFGRTISMGKGMGLKSMLGVVRAAARQRLAAAGGSSSNDRT